MLFLTSQLRKTCESSVVSQERITPLKIKSDSTIAESKEGLNAQSQAELFVELVIKNKMKKKNPFIIIY